MTARQLRILVLSPVEPFPPRGGWQTVICNDIRSLAARGHEITVLAITYEDVSKACKENGFAQVELFFRKRAPKWRQVIGNFGHELPYTITRNYDERLMARIREFVAAGKVDVLLVEDVVMGHYVSLLRAKKSVPAYLRGHNVSTVVCKRYYESQRNPVLRFLGWRQYVKFMSYERSVVSDFDGVCQLSAVDASEMERINPEVKNDVIPTGVDSDYFSVDSAIERDPATIMHVGTLDPITKLPAMHWFYEKVFSQVVKKHSNARLELVGRTPQCELYHVDPERVIVHGLVPDVRPYLARATVFIAPQFIGSGIRVKILNAMATGNAVVATPVACEGLEVTDGENILIARGEEEFVERVSSLLADRALRDRIGRNARLLVEQRYDCSRVAKELERQLTLLVQRYDSRSVYE